MIFGLPEGTGRFAFKRQEDTLCRYTVQSELKVTLNLSVEMKCLFYIGIILSGLA